MRLYKLLLAAMAATAALAALTATASARSFSITNQFVRTQFREVDFEGAFGDTICGITLEGSLHSRTIAKVRDSLVGYVTAARLGLCSLGRATVLAETLPWHFTYDSFTGTLPNILTKRYRIINVSIRIISNTGENCLARSTREAPAIATGNIGAGGLANTARIEGTGIPTSCFFTGRFRSDDGPVTVLNASTRVTVRLI